MAMRAEVRWQGRRLWTERGRQAASEGLARALEHTLGVSNTRVPLRDGPLERSGKVIVNGLQGSISYDTPYAVRQHEELTWRHLPGRQAKYLESAVNDSREVMLALMAVPCGGGRAVADLHDGLARYLASLGLVTYDPDGETAGDVFFDVLPPAPDSAVCLTVYGGGPVDSLLPYDSPSVQVRVRAPADNRALARSRAADLYSALHGLGPCDLPDGTRLILAVANASPGSMGQDDLGRLEWVFNVALEVYAPSAHRPA